MPHPKKNLLSSGIFIISFLVIFATFIEKLELHKLKGFDQEIINRVQERIDNPNTRLMKLFTFLGSPAVVSLFVALFAAFLYVRGRKREAWGMLLANAAGAGFNEGLKHIVRRRRPDIHRLVTVHGYSFPSGHAMGSIMFYGTLSYLICRRIQSLFCRLFVYSFSVFMVLMTGISRIYLGVHYPSDVLSGYAAAGAWLSASIKGFQASSSRR